MRRATARWYRICRNSTEKRSHRSICRSVRTDQFVGYVNVLQQRAKRWKENGEVEKTDVPDYSKENLGICREALMEAVAETSEEFMDRYFGGEEFSEDETDRHCV